MKAVALIGLGAALLGARPADACAPPPCRPGLFLPGDGAMVPANLPAILWQPMDNGDAPDPAMVTLVATDDPSTPIPFAATLVLATGSYTLVPTTPLVAGKQYALVDATVCANAPDFAPHATFAVTGSAPLPTSLGITTATPDSVGSLGVPGDTCFDVQTVSAMTDIGLAMSAEAMPWRHVLLYKTTVDGQPWVQSNHYGWPIPQGSSWLGRGLDRVYETCSASSGGNFDTGVSDGAHQVAFHATLAYTDVALDAVPASIYLSCNDPASGSGSDRAAGGCLSASPSTPGALAGALVLLLAGRRRRARP